MAGPSPMSGNRATICLILLIGDETMQLALLKCDNLHSLLGLKSLCDEVSQLAQPCKTSLLESPMQEGRVIFVHRRRAKASINDTTVAPSTRSPSHHTSVRVMASICTARELLVVRNGLGSREVGRNCEGRDILLCLGSQL